MQYDFLATNPSRLAGEPYRGGDVLTLCAPVIERQKARCCVLRRRFSFKCVGSFGRSQPTVARPSVALISVFSRSRFDRREPVARARSH